MKVYISGPMAGYANLNFDAFHDAAYQLRRRGIHVVSPVEVGWERFGTKPDNKPAVVEYLREDLRALLDCDAVHLLPGWQKSIGAKAEAAMAVALGLLFVDKDGFTEPPPALIEVTGYPTNS